VLANLTKLTKLELIGCTSLSNVDGLAKLNKLTNLDLTDCSSLENLNGISSLFNIKVIGLWNCKSLINVVGLANLSNLNSLILEGCYNINVIPEGYTMKEEDNEAVELYDEELKSYLQKIRDHISTNN
jgi:hypothetical protein